MSDIESGTPPVGDASALLGKLLSNPDLLRNLSSVLGATSGSGGGGGQTVSEPQAAPSLMNNETVTEGISRVLSNPEMMAKLPDVMKMLAPMMQGAQSAAPAIAPASVAVSHGDERDKRGCRNDLLLALKPFLSPERCRAIDMLLGLSRLGDVLQKMI